MHFQQLQEKYFLGAKIIGKRFFVIEYAKIIVSNIYITEGKNIFNERLIKLKEFFLGCERIITSIYFTENAFLIKIRIKRLQTNKHHMTNILVFPDLSS